MTQTVEYNSCKLIKANGDSRVWASVMHAEHTYSECGQEALLVITQDTNNGPQEWAHKMQKGDRAYIMNGLGNNIAVYHGGKR